MAEDATTSLQRCCICLEELRTDVAHSSCDVCNAAYHNTCAARHALALAEEKGEPEAWCPGENCRESWSLDLTKLFLAADGELAARYEIAAAAARELRASRPVGGTDWSPQLLQELRPLGIRDCPSCGALIQKQPDGLITGCDKMTCRCGCMFCFVCGRRANGGAARCRCVGFHHSFIPHSEVLNNYSSHGVSFSSVDQDLSKRSRNKPSKETLARLRKELKAMHKDPPPLIHISSTERTVTKMNFLLQGPPDTPFEKGWYWGRLEVLDEYPYWPPLIKIITPTGRFEEDDWLCRTTLDYHPDGWQPAWTLAGLLLAVLSLMDGDSFTAGALRPSPPDADRRRLAEESLAWNLASKEFRAAFPNIEEIVKDDIARSDAPSAAAQRRTKRT
eukprot:TRINITY_DN36764_c0_g1_i1.p1 TRINITY_DN36764_c0_g1~~TRINITY_DN36764_c0_g1_i1.p1  ORF type:complete len:390 (+),score=48.39 TRINITY_DN36764_c0_g1_i1:55-1224(+)